MTENLARTAGPADFDPVSNLELTQPEVHAEVARGSISSSRRHLVVLVADPDFRADAIPVRSRPRQFENKPSVSGGAHVLPKLRCFAEGRNNRIYFSVVIEVSKRRTS